MIDKYKRPRVQRLVPERGPAPRRSPPSAWLQEAARMIIEKRAASTEAIPKEQRAAGQ